MSGLKPSRSTLVILSITTVLSVLVFAFAYIEVTTSRNDLLTSKHNEAVTLIESMAHSTGSSIAANTLLEDLLVSHLRTAAQFIRHRERSPGMSGAYLQHQARRMDVSILAVLDGEGKPLFSNIPISRVDTETLAAIDSITSGIYQWLELPGLVVAAGSGEEQRFYAVGMARAETPGVMIAGLSERVLLDYRRRTGIGSMIQDLAGNSEILYVLIQDEDGILTASKGISSMSSIASDAFLAQAFGSDSARTRIVDYKGESIMEAVQRVDSEAGFFYLARIGLSLENVRQIQQRSMRRVIIIGIALVALGALVLGFIFTRRRFSSLQQEHRRVKTSTDLIMENIADGVIATGTDGKVSFMNVAARDVFDGEDGPLGGHDPLFLKETLGTSTPIPYRESVIQRKGKERILGVSTSIIGNPDGGVESVIAIFRDLTGEKRAEEQLRRHERLTALGELAGGVAHEIRNPLNAIGIIAQRLRAEFEPERDREEYARLTSTVRSEVERVNTIIKQFLDFARPPKLQLERIWLHVAANGALEVIASQARAAGVRVELSVDGHIYILADRNMLQQAVLNLYQNALDAMPGGGRLDIAVYASEGRAALRIADTGSGIPRDVQAKMFNLYFSTKSTGTGLGLSIVHQIISEHGGEITVESTPGAGATFTVYLPIAEETVTG